MGITPWVGALSAKEAVMGGAADVLRFFLGPSTTTDENGRFELLDVPRAHVQFHLISDEIVPSYAAVEDVQDPDSFEIRVLARVHLEVECVPGAESPQAFRALDDDGELVTLLKMRADGYSHQPRVALVEGRSGVVTITSNATTLQFLRDGQVLDSIPISPRPGETLNIRR